jgi:hypothetical protein
VKARIYTDGEGDQLTIRMIGSSAVVEIRQALGFQDDDEETGRATNDEVCVQFDVWRLKAHLQDMLEYIAKYERGEL